MRLGFIAMSGVRCQNQELLALGLTLPGFVERSKVIASLPSLGLLTLAGMTPRDMFDIEYVEVPDAAALTGLPGEFDAVAISSFSAQVGEAYSLADRYRAAGTKVILGGLHVTAMPAEAALHADAVVIGEGEPVWPALLKDLSHGRLNHTYDARGHQFDLRDAPMPAYELLDIPRYNRLTVQTQRGCPHNCEFCAASIRIAPRFTVKPVEKVIQEIRRIRQLWDHPFIEFADDNTFANRRHGRELVTALRDEHIRWFTETDISVAEDEGLLDLMKEAGCAQILVGLESPQAEPLNGLELRANWKQKRRDGYLRAIERIQKRGITVNGCFVLGLDGSDRTSFDAVLEFVRESGLYEVQITLLTPFPGTPLRERLSREGRLTDNDDWRRATLFDVNFKPQRMSASELEAGFRELGRQIYETEAVEARRRRFFENWRMARDGREQDGICA